MTATENLKAVKHGKPAHEMRTNHVVNDEGTLSKLNLAKLTKILSTFADAARDMETQLITATSSSDIISPALVQQLSAVKCEMDAEAAALQLFKENNLEEDTVNVVKAAMTKLNAARNQFKLMEKMLKAMPAHPIPTDDECETVPALL